MTEKYGATQKQREAWSYYGFDFGSNRAHAQGDKHCRPVGEVRYIVGWIADQMSRMRWTVLMDGSPEWAVKLPDGTDVSSRPTEGEDATEVSAKASAQVLEAIGWTGETIREVATNLFVAGELWYIATDKRDKDTWQVVSVVHSNIEELLDKKAKFKIHALWPHPADPSKPDAPIFGVLPILEQMDWLSRLDVSQSASRISTRGIVGIADGLDAANGGDLGDEFDKAITAKMVDPTDVSPVILRGNEALIEPVVNGRGMKGFSWVIPEFPFSDHLDSQMRNLIRRLAYGLPIPPEIVFGLQAQSRATAFQVEENSYRAHIQPAATRLAQVPKQALQLIVPNKTITIIPDPTDLLARRNSVQDVKDAFDRGAVSFAYFRQVLGIPESAAATEDDIELHKQIKATEDGAEDPANIAADEGVNASVGGPDDPALDDAELDTLSRVLTELDRSLLAELAGATVQAVDRAREKIGANARSRESLRGKIPKEIPNGQVAKHLGVSNLRSAGVPIDEIIAASCSGLGEWWTKRAHAAIRTVDNILGPEAAPGFSDTEVDDSVEVLLKYTSDHILDTLEDEDASTLSAELRAEVLTVLGGGS